MNPDQATRFRRATDRLSRELNVSATDEGLTPTQASVLGLIATRGPLGVGELVDAERLNPTMVSRVISRLVTLGFVQRIPQPHDRRAIHVAVTDSGRTVQQRIKAQRTATLSDCIATLTPEAAESLTAAIEPLEALVAELLKRGHHDS